MRKNRLRKWELALLAALGVTLFAGGLARRDEQALSRSLIRLHVVARSDSPADQAEKLQMRDKVLEVLSPLLADCAGPEEASDLIRGSFPLLESLGDVRVTLAREYFPTRQYEGFALPAGEYDALRVVIGEGGGRNWWCVVFPPLCTEALAKDADDTQAFLSLDGDARALITGDGPEYVLRFRIAEWWGQLRQLLTEAGQSLGVGGSSGGS